MSMDIILLFLVSLVISIGWFTGMRITQMLDEAVWKAINNSKVVKAYKKKKNTNKKKPTRYHETKMGF